MKGSFAAFSYSFITDCHEYCDRPSPARLRKSMVDSGSILHDIFSCSGILPMPWNYICVANPYFRCNSWRGLLASCTRWNINEFFRSISDFLSNFLAPRFARELRVLKSLISFSGLVASLLSFFLSPRFIITLGCAISTISVLATYFAKSLSLIAIFFGIFHGKESSRSANKLNLIPSQQDSGTVSWSLKYHQY